MVVMDLPELLAERGVPSEVYPRHFMVIDRRSPLYQRVIKRRFNPQSSSQVPMGYALCAPPCGLLAEIDFDSKIAKCPDGHEIDLAAEEQKHFDPGGCTRVGLTLKEQGDIGEEVVKRLNSLGEWGKVAEWCEHYNAPLDGITDRGWGIEVKTKSTRAAKLEFEPGKKDARARKLAEAEKRGLKGILEVLVILDFDLSKARIFIKPRRRGQDLKFWSIPPTPPLAVVDFTEINPFITPPNPLKDVAEDLPF